MGESHRHRARIVVRNLTALLFRSKKKEKKTCLKRFVKFRCNHCGFRFITHGTHRGMRVREKKRKLKAPNGVRRWFLDDALRARSVAKSHILSAPPDVDRGSVRSGKERTAAGIRVKRVKYTEIFMSYARSHVIENPIRRSRLQVRSKKKEKSI